MGTKAFKIVAGGGSQNFTVPANVTSVKWMLWGAPGSLSKCGGAGGTVVDMAGGNGGYTEGVIACTPGDVHKVTVGVPGTLFPDTGQGTFYGSGGGATDIRIGGTGLASRVLVAGGGGAAGYASYCTQAAATALAFRGGDGGGLVAGDAPSMKWTITLTITGSPVGNIGITLYGAHTLDAWLNSSGFSTSTVTKAWNATPADWQTALQAHDPSITVTGTAGVRYVFTLASAPPFQNLDDELVIDPSGLTGGGISVDCGGGMRNIPGIGGTQALNTHTRGSVGRSATDGASGTGGNGVGTPLSETDYIPVSYTNPTTGRTDVDLTGLPFAGGNGGDGYFGGGGGGGVLPGTLGTVAGGGGGGSAYIDPSVTFGLTEVGALTHPSAFPTQGYAVAVWNDPPTAPTITSPANGGLVVAGQDVEVDWQFNDPDPADFQSKADFRYRVTGNPTWTTIAAAATTLSKFVLASGIIASGTNYELQVLTYDSSGIASPWSPSVFVTGAIPPGAPTITSPASGATVALAQQPITWTLPAGYSQIGYQLRRCSDAAGTIVYWLGPQITSTAQTGLVQMDAVSGRTDHLQVSFDANGFWSPFGDVAVDVELGPPPVPMLTGEQLLTDDGTPAPKVRLRVTNPTASGEFSPTVSNSLDWLQPDGTWLRIANGVAVNGFFDWIGVPVGDPVFRCEAFALNGASNLSIIGGPS